MGRNGMGKTTLLRSLLGLVRPRAGEVGSTASSIAGLRAISHRALGVGVRAREAAASSRPSRCARTCCWPRATARAATRGRWNACWRRFRALAERHGAPRQRALGRRTADADHRPRADDQSAPVAARRSDRGLGAADRARHLAHDRHVREAAWRWSSSTRILRCCAALADRCVILVKGRKVFDALARASSRRSPDCASAIWASSTAHRPRGARISSMSPASASNACGSAGKSAPTLVFLHEGLGSVAMWRDFPQRVADATGCPALVYSRAGYGRSSPLTLPRATDYMHVEALTVLPALLDRLGIERPILIGHSDGASIALIHAGSGSARGAGGGGLRARTCSSRRCRWRASPKRANGATTAATCGNGSPATTPTSTRHSAAGTTSGSRRQFRGWNIESFAARHRAVRCC